MNESLPVNRWTGYGGPGRDARARISRQVSYLCYAIIGLFWLNSIYDWEVSSLIKTIKWIPVAALIVVAGSEVARRRLLSRDRGHVAVLMAILAFAMSIPNSAVPMTSSATLVSVAAIMFSTWVFAAAYLRDLTEKIQFFDIVSRIGRVVTALSFLMWLLHIDLGRGGDRVSTWTDNPNTLAMLLAPTIIVLSANVIHRRRWWLRDALIILIALLLVRATGSRAALLWIIVSFAAFWVARRGLGAGVLAATTGFVALFVFRDQLISFMSDLSERAQDFASNSHHELLSGREEVWEYGKELFFSHPFLGNGLGSSEALIGAKDWSSTQYFGSHFHNSYITILVETGLAGLAVFILLLAPPMLRGLGASNGARTAQPEEWAYIALPWVILCGALAHAMFETWLLSAGNQNSFIFWSCLWMLRRD